MKTRLKARESHQEISVGHQRCGQFLTRDNTGRDNTQYNTGGENGASR
jgi:hypothetical protein